MKKMNKKGFTLIELLAVIVILGLLMAIAIPSVTKYITQSRKKTLTSTIGNYMSALTNEVNNLEYTFTAPNTIYAVPIECVALERGGTNPFGSWMNAGDNQWAYVLVQYDDDTSSYIYGFTFKDTAGYGMYPTVQNKVNAKGNDILTTTGKAIKETYKKHTPSFDEANNKVVSINISQYTAKNNWIGFAVDDNTQLIVFNSVTSGANQSNATCLRTQQ